MCVSLAFSRQTKSGYSAWIQSERHGKPSRESPGDSSCNKIRKEAVLLAVRECRRPSKMALGSGYPTNTHIGNVDSKARDTIDKGTSQISSVSTLETAILVYAA